MTLAVLLLISTDIRVIIVHVQLSFKCIPAVKGKKNVTLKRLRCLNDKPTTIYLEL